MVETKSKALQNLTQSLDANLQDAPAKLDS
jgi:hypothetical protein